MSVRQVAHQPVALLHPIDEVDVVNDFAEDKGIFYVRHMLTLIGVTLNSVKRNWEDRESVARVAREHGVSANMVHYHAGSYSSGLPVRQSTGCFVWASLHGLMQHFQTSGIGLLVGGGGFGGRCGPGIMLFHVAPPSTVANS